MIYTDSLAEELKPDAGRKWRPSNGTEGELFIERFCQHCIHDADHRDDTGSGCEILIRTWAYDIDDPKYPAQWRIGPDGQPTCTAFEEEKERRPE